MKLNFEQENRFKEYSRKLNMPFAAVVQGYVVESVLQQLEKSVLRNVIWFSGRGRIGKEAYEKHLAGRLDFCYIRDQKRRHPAGSAETDGFFTEELLSEVTDELFPEKNRQGIRWEQAKRHVCGTEAVVQMTGCLEEMSVPVEIRLHAILADGTAPQEQQIISIFQPKKVITCLAYPAENILAENFAEIMLKLELISDMESYAKANKILKEQSISGRTVIEILEEKAGQDPSFRKEKRLGQLQSYQKYAYMRKRWDKYRNHHEQETDHWEDVMQRILDFAKPIWEAFCENEIFLDDWMPELGRFLM